MSDNFFSEKVNINEWLFLIIAPTTILYHIDKYEYFGDKQLEYVEYFSDEKSVTNVDLVSLYKSSKILKLLAMDELSNLSRLYSQAPENVKYSITRCFGYSPYIEQINREKDYEHDNVIAQYICNQGLDGFANQTNFYPEVVLCDPINKLNMISNLVSVENSDKIEQSIVQKRKPGLFYL
jgi:hypothetical protein